MMMSAKCKILSLGRSIITKKRKVCMLLKPIVFPTLLSSICISILEHIKYKTVNIYYFLILIPNKKLTACCYITIYVALFSFIKIRWMIKIVHFILCDKNVIFMVRAMACEQCGVV